MDRNPDTLLSLPLPSVCCQDEKSTELNSLECSGSKHIICGKQLQNRQGYLLFLKHDLNLCPQSIRSTWVIVLQILLIGHIITTTEKMPVLAQDKPESKCAGATATNQVSNTKFHFFFNPKLAKQFFLENEKVVQNNPGFKAEKSKLKH